MQFCNFIQFRSTRHKHTFQFPSSGMPRSKCFQIKWFRLPLSLSVSYFGRLYDHFGLKRKEGNDVYLNWILIKAARSETTKYRQHLRTKMMRFSVFLLLLPLALATSEPRIYRPFISCDNLSLEEFCTGGRFAYTDGCNFLRCNGKGFGSSTFMLCQSERALGKSARNDCDIVRRNAMIARSEA